MGKRFLVVTKNSAGSIEFHPMKQWLRDHVALIPGKQYRPEQTSRQWLSFLRKSGWQASELEEEVRLVPPELAEDATSLAVIGTPNDDVTEDEEDEAAEFGFEFERQLRDFLANNLGRIPVASKGLRMYKDASGRSGVEYPTEVGPIDILAVDQDGNFVVFELKNSRGPDRTMGQLLRYMGWIRRKMAGEKQVFGVIVAREMDEKLKFAALEVPKVSLMEYEIDFKLKSVAV